MKKLINDNHLAFILFGILLLSPMAAAAGMSDVSGLIDKIVAGFILFSKGVLTLAFLWVGYKVLFAGSALRDVAPVIIGAIIIGSAAALADLFKA